MAEKPEVCRNLVAAAEDVAGTLDSALATLVVREHSATIEFIQLLNFNGKLDAGQQAVLRQVLDFLIRRKASVHKKDL